MFSIYLSYTKLTDFVHLRVMPDYLNVSEFLNRMKEVPVIDVRSPSEFGSGHIPGSYNIPLLNDKQRAEIGTCYKEKGRSAAIELGFERVGPQLIDKIRQVKKIATDRRLLVYCWRGGMRSGNMAWLFETNGIRCQVLEKGYKAFRQFGKSAFSGKMYRSFVLGGFTGSNKTVILEALGSMGEQVLDIEAKAHHRGSSFGRIGQPAQVPNEQFENDLIMDWLRFDPDKRIWIEDESKILGSNHIPEPLYQRIRESGVIKLEVDKTQRAKNLVEAYGGLNDEELEKAIRRIEKKLGGQNMQIALDALQNKNYQKVAEMSLSYYDKTYAFGLSRRNPSTISHLKPTSNDPVNIACQLIETVEKLENS